MNDMEIFKLSSSKMISPSITTDGQYHVSVSVLPSEDFSEKIIKTVDDIFDVRFLKRLQKSSFPAFLKQAKFQVEELSKQFSLFNVHAYKYRVLIYIKVGEIFNRVEKACPKKSDYSKWLRSLGQEPRELSQHAKKLAKMGSFAVKQASLGKNRLLELDRIREKQDTTFGELLQLHAFPDTNVDDNGAQFKTHIDAIITYYRLIKAEVTCVTFSQAKFMAMYSRKSLQVKEANRIKNHLEQHADEEQAFNLLIDNMQTSPRNNVTHVPLKKSVDRILSDLIIYFNDIDLNSPSQITAVKNKISPRIFFKANLIMQALTAELNADLSMPLMITHEEGA